MAIQDQYKVGRLCRLKRIIWSQECCKFIQPQFVIILKHQITKVNYGYGISSKGTSYLIYLCEDMCEIEGFFDDLVVAEKSPFRSRRGRKT